MKTDILAKAALMLRAGLKSGLQSAVLAAFIVVSLPSQVLAESAPALWKASRSDATVYIFGTIHILKPETQWLTPEVQARFDEAGSLVIEAADISGPNAEVAQLVMSLGMYPPGNSLDANISAETYAAVVAEAHKIGLPEQAVQRMRPWLASITLTSVSAMMRGYLPQYGVDVTLEKMAHAAGKSIIGLETAEFQMKLFAGMPEDLQAEMLEMTLEQIGELDELFELMTDSWLTGDIETLGALMNEGIDENREMMEMLITNRNRTWVGQIDEILARPGITFIAVGAGHMAGENSLIGMLRDAGINIERE